MTPTGLLVVLQTLGSPRESQGLISAQDGRLKVQDFTMFSSCGFAKDAGVIDENPFSLDGNCMSSDRASRRAAIPTIR